MADTTTTAETLATQLRDFIRTPKPVREGTQLQGGFQRQVGQPAQPPRKIESRGQIYADCLRRLTTEEQRDALGEVISELERMLR